MLDLLGHARRAGCSALVFTVDMPVPGTRYRDYRSGLAGEKPLTGTLRRFTQAAMRPRWAWDVGLMGRPHQLGNIAPLLGKDSGMEDFMAWMKGNFDPGITWKDLDFVRENWDGPIIIKGILDPADAIDASKAGVDGIVVSNHGGRQLDGVLADGGVTSGLDVVRLLALGADLVLIGRSWVYALASRGQQGVAHVIDLLQQEMKVAMALTGCRTISEIGSDCIAIVR